MFKDIAINKSEVYRGLIKNFPDIVVILDKHMNIIDISDRFLTLYDLGGKDEVIGKNAFEFIAPEDHELAKKNIEKVFKEGFLKMVEFNFLEKDGSRFIGELSLSIVENNKGEAKFLIGIIRDISKQKKIEEDLLNSQQMFQLVIDNIPQFIFWKDIDSVYIGCNKNFARVAGVNDPKNIIGKTDYDLAWKKSEAEAFFETDRLVLELGKPEYHIIESQLQADGKQAWLDKNKIPLHNSKGNVVGILGTYEDISDRIIAKEKLEKSEKKFREAYNRAEFYKDLFAHDISNILQNVLSSIELCNFYSKDTKREAEIENLFEIIKNQVKRGSDLVSNVRKLSLIDEFNERTENLDIIQIINRSIKEIHEKFPNNKINIQIESSYNEILVRANNLLIDVFLNIFTNAVIHNENPITEIKIKLSREESDFKNFIKIECIDNGIGIVDERKNIIFQKDFREEKSFSRIGLGLSLVKNILESYNAKIWVEDKVQGDYSKGSNFIILISEA